MSCADALHTASVARQTLPCRRQLHCFPPCRCEEARRLFRPAVGLLWVLTCITTNQLVPTSSQVSGMGGGMGGVLLWAWPCIHWRLGPCRLLSPMCCLHHS